MEIFNTKKKLPGERKPVFPEGTPGVPQGVPQELVKGYQEPGAEAKEAQAAAPKPPPAEAKPKPKPKVVAKPKTDRPRLRSPSGRPSRNHKPRRNRSRNPRLNGLIRHPPSNSGPPLAAPGPDRRSPRAAGSRGPTRRRRADRPSRGRPA